jgi:hypothetical protein
VPRVKKPRGFVSTALTDLHKNFDSDIAQFLAIHQQIGGTGPGRRSGVEGINRAAILTLCAYWEAYCEDCLRIALLTFTQALSPDYLPSATKKLIIASLKSDKDELALWRLCGDGWRVQLAATANEIRTNENFLNTPRHTVLDERYERYIGLKLSSHWAWKGMTSRQAVSKLERFIKLRGSIAHRGVGASPVRLSDVLNYTNFIKRLAEATDVAVREVSLPVYNQGRPAEEQAR